MAHLEVEPKPSRPWWIWLLTVIVLLTLVLVLLKNCNTEPTASPLAKNTAKTANV